MRLAPRLTVPGPYLSAADRDRTGERFLLSGCYVYGELDYFAYMEYLDAPGSLRHIWWDLSANERDRWREITRQNFPDLA